MRAVSDVTRNNATLTVTGSSGTTAPSAGTSQSWTVTALPASLGVALRTGETLRLVDSTAGASAAQQAEIVLLTASTGSGATSIAVTRGVEGTTPVAHSTGATFAAVITKAVIDGMLTTGIHVNEAPLSPARYGVTSDSNTDDTAAWAAVMAAMPSGGGHILLAAGASLVTAPVVLPNKCSLTGMGRSASEIHAKAGFSGVGVVRIGKGPAAGEQFAFGCRVENLAISAGGNAAVGVYTNSIQEQSGIYRCLITDWT